MIRPRPEAMAEYAGVAFPKVSAYNGEVGSASRPAKLIILAPEMSGYYHFVKPRQEAKDESIVVLLDRRQGERRYAERRRNARSESSDRRHRQRRSTPAQAANALMTVLGFSILHRVGDRYTT